MAGDKPPAGTREHHDEFCTAEKWTLVRGATGRPVTHHRTYELTLWDARILRTRISRPIDSTTYSRSMWSHILRNQLEVTQEAFWACVQEGVLPDRGGPQKVAVKEKLPLHLYRQLRDLGVPEEDIAPLSAAQAAQRIADIYQGHAQAE